MSSSGEESVGMVSESDSDNESTTQRERSSSVESLSDLSDSSTGSAGSGSDFTSLLDKATTRVRNTIKEKAQKKAAAAAKTVQSKKVGKDTPVKKSSVIYIGHVPHGFYEDQMRGFLSQFGIVTRLRLSRNKKTGRSKHYAFVEFEKRPVAKIVAAAMNGYFLAGRRLVCHVVKRDDVHEKMFKGSNRKFRPIPWRLIEKQRHNAPKNQGQVTKVVSSLISKEKRKRDKLKELGITYEFEGYEGALKKQKQATEVSTEEVTKEVTEATKKTKKKGKKGKK